MATNNTGSEHRRGHRRDQFRTFALATAKVVKQEVSKHVHQLLEESTSAGNLSGGTHGEGFISRKVQSLSISSNEESANNISPHCMLFPSYAFCDSSDMGRRQWHVRLKGWTFAKASSSRMEKFMMAAGRTYGGIIADSIEDARFGKMLNQFRCQTMRGVDIQLAVTNRRSATQESLSKAQASSSHRAHLQQRFQQLQTQLHDLPRAVLDTILVNSGPTGRFEQTIALDPSCTHPDNYPNHTICLEVALNDVLDGSAHDGFVDMIEPHGISVISDIDDTIKITGILEGKDAILRKTFFQKACEVPGMSELFRTWAGRGAHFHYVSNGPWELYPALSEFLMENGFPLGSMHLRPITKGSLFRKKISHHKIDVITQILQDFPHRKFVLVGDSGERDPEIYREMYDRFPSQVIKICIHDVTSEYAKAADRRAMERTDSYYNTLHKLLTRESMPVDRTDSVSTFSLLDAIGDVDVPEKQQQMLDADTPEKTMLELFEEKIANASSGLPDGVFTLFTNGDQLWKDLVLARFLGGSDQQNAMHKDEATTLWAAGRHDLG